MFASPTSRSWLVAAMLATLLACGSEHGAPSHDEAGTAEPLLTACPDVPYDHLEESCAGDFQCTIPVGECCHGGTVCNVQGFQCRDGVFKYLGFNESCSGAAGTAGIGGAGAVGGVGGVGGTGGAGGGTPSGVGISADYPNDEGIEDDARVIFHSSFEQGLTGWSSHTDDTERLDVIKDSALSHAGEHHLRAQVTRADLAQDQYVSAQAQIDFSRRVPQVFVRFYARFVGETATPHHWVRFAAGTPSFQTDGLANTRPQGDDGFWLDLDAGRDQLFNFYVYWYQMRSGRCNDGSATDGCEGDQGTTYYYGNNFKPAEQQPLPRDAWLCLEVMVKANALGESDGELALWQDDQLVGEYKPGSPRGRWLRDNFYSWGEYYEDEQAFEGFDFRASEDVLLKRFTLDAYYQEDTLNDYAMELPVPEAQIILYDDVVIAEQRVGCMH